MTSGSRVKLGWLAAIGLVLLFAGACGAPWRRAAPDIVVPPDRAWTPLIGWPSPAGRVLLGRSNEGRPIHARVFGTGDDCALIIATIHGDEWAGTPLVERLAEHLDDRSALVRDRCVVLMPLANPDGYVRRSRYNAHRIDLNRNFPAGNRVDNRRNGLGALSEPESRAIHAAIRRFRPSRIVSIHQPVDCVDYDGPGSALAARMALAGDMDVRRLGARPGSLGSYAGETLGIPIITLEFPAAASRLDEDALWDRYGPMLLAAIEYNETLAK